MNKKNGHEYISRLEACSIYMFGAGTKAHYFYEKYKNKLDLKAFLSNEIWIGGEDIDSKTNLMIYNPLNVIPSLTENSAIIICVDEFEEIERQLIGYGLKAGENYIHYKFYELLKSEKKIALFYGVCYMRPICNLLNKSPLFSSEYEVFFFLSYQRMVDTENSFFDFLISVCDLYAYNPSISRQEHAIENAILSRLKSECIKIKISAVGGEAYHPQLIENENKRMAYSVVPEASAYGSFTSQDWVVNNYIDEGVGLEEIRKRIKDKTFFNHEYVLNNYKEKMRLFELQEGFVDIKISDYLIENHKKKRLYLDGIHIGNDPICELANRFLDYIKLDRCDYSDEIDSVLIYASEVPVYNSVIEALDLTIYEEKEPLYNLFTFNGYIKVTFDEYLDRYYDYCTHVKDYLKKGYLI